MKNIKILLILTVTIIIGWGLLIFLSKPLQLPVTAWPLVLNTQNTERYKFRVLKFKRQGEKVYILDTFTGDVSVLYNPIKQGSFWRHYKVATA